MTGPFLTRDEDETAAAGRAIATDLTSDELLYFRGDLGAGKTTLIRAIAGALGADVEEVASPTFAIVHEYPARNGETLVHLDCYRLTDDLREWEEIGIPDILRQSAVKFVEWPKVGFSRYAAPSGVIELTVQPDQSREIVFTRPGNSPHPRS